MIFQELQNGPQDMRSYSIIPQGTKLLSIETKDGLCTVNLSKEFIDNNHSGTTGEMLTISAIVNSLTELPEVKKVQFLVEGQVRDVYLNAEFDKPFTRNESIIMK